VDHVLRRLVSYGDGGRGVDAVLVGLEAKADVVQLHVLGVDDDRLWSIARAGASRDRGVVRDGQNDDTSAVVFAIGVRGRAKGSPRPEALVVRPRRSHS